MSSFDINNPPPPGPLIPSSLQLRTLQVNQVADIQEIVGNTLTSINTWKGSVRAASTANLTLSGEQTVDGVVLVDGDEILVKNQSTGSQNGIWVVKTDAWVRSQKLDTGGNAAGVAVFINEGTLSGDTIWVCTDNAASAVVGTDPLTFVTITTVVGAAGSDTQVQYNASGSFAGSSLFTFTVGSGTVTATNFVGNTSVTSPSVLATGATGVLGHDAATSAPTAFFGLYGTTPIVQVTTGVASAAFVAGVGTAVNDDSTFGGYTLGQVVQALQNYGLLG